MSLHHNVTRQYYEPYRPTRVSYYAFGSAIIAGAKAATSFDKAFRDLERSAVSAQERGTIWRHPPSLFVKFIAQQEVWRVNELIDKRPYDMHLRRIYPVRMKDADSRTRRVPCMILRWSIMERLRDYGYSLAGIGDAVGKDHTSVIHGLQRIRAIRSIERFLRGLAR